MEGLRILAAAILILLFLPFSSALSESGGAGSGQPTVEWKSKAFGGDHYMYCDTDQDGFEEILIYSDSTLMVLDPPSYEKVLYFKGGSGLCRRGGISIVDLGGNGHLQIVLSCEDIYDRHTSNWTVFSGEDFIMLWKSPDIRIPHLDNGINILQEIMDVDNDGEKEFICLSNNSNQSGILACIQIYDGVSFELKWRSPAFKYPIGFMAENIDSDHALELMMFQGTDDGYPAFISLQVFDGSTHHLQWELPERDGVRFDLEPYHSTAAADGYYYPDIQDITDNSEGRSVVNQGILDITHDGIKDIVVEYQQYDTESVSGNVTDSGICVYSGQTGALEWNITTTGKIPEMEYDSGHGRLRMFIDAYGDGQIELLVLSPQVGGPISNDTDIRIYSGETGALKWNLTVPGFFLDLGDPLGILPYMPIVNVGDIDGDGNLELLITSGIETSPDTVGITYEIVDVKENKSLWRMGPVAYSGSRADQSELYAQDINSDGAAEIIIGNYSFNDSRNGENTDDNIYTSFQVLNGEFNITWTSPTTIPINTCKRMELMNLKESSPSIMITNDFTLKDGIRTDNTLHIFSMKDFQEIATLHIGNGSISYYTEDIVNDSNPELIVEVPPDDELGKCGSLHVFDTRTFNEIWTSPEFVSLEFLRGIDMTGDPEKELIFESFLWNWSDFDPFSGGGNPHYNISIYNDSGQKLIWSSESITTGQIIDVKDIDKDGNVELILSIGRIIILQFPRDGLWTDVPDWDNLDNPPTIIAFSAPNNITVDASERLTFSVDAIDPDGDDLTYRWEENGTAVSTEPNFTQKFPPGDHIMRLTISDHYLYATRTINFKVSSLSEAPPILNLASPWPGVIAATAAIAGVALALSFAAGTEVGKYRLTGFLLPLYTRIRKEEMLDHETRGILRGFIVAEPGVHFNEILRRLKLSNGTASYHLMALEREGFIKSRSDGRLKRFYPAEMNLIDIPPKLEMIQDDILKTVQQSDGLGQRELARILDIPHSTVNRHVKKLVELGLLLLVKEGMTTRCYLSDEKKRTLTTEKTDEALHWNVPWPSLHPYPPSQTPPCPLAPFTQ